MPAPTVKRGKTPLSSGDACPRCTHLLSAHDSAKTNQCNSCSCVAQDTSPDARSYQNVGAH